MQLKPAKSNIEEKKYNLLAITFLALAALLLRIHKLNFESLFMDELHQISYYQNDFTQLIYLAASQQQPPLDYWIGHIVSYISYSDYFVRLPAVFFGVGAVVFMYLILQKHTDKTVAIVICLLMSLLPFHIYFSQQARPYSIAIFFCIALLYLVGRYMDCSKTNRMQLLLIFITTYCFLLSRTLSPLVVVVSLLIIYSTFIVFSLLKNNFLNIPRNMFVQLLVTKVIAIIIYLPFFLIILKNGQRYTGSSNLTGFSVWLAGISNFSPLPMWEAYNAQLEPISILLLPVLLLFPLIVLKNNLLKGNKFILTMLILLPLTCIINLYVFQSKTVLPFRPPYAIYLFPFCLIWVAISLHHILLLIKRKKRIFAITIFLFFCVFTFTQTVSSMIEFKSIRKNSDWRGLSTLLEKQYFDNKILIFNGIDSYGLWEPTFYGFERYYKKESNKINVASIPDYLSGLEKLISRPAFILFHYRNYFLTKHSKFPIIGKPEPIINHDFRVLVSDSDLKVDTLTGFIVISLNKSSGSTVIDMLTIIEKVTTKLPKSTALIEWHLAAAALKKLLNQDDWLIHLEVVETLAPKEYRTEIKSRTSKIRGQFITNN